MVSADRIAADLFDAVRPSRVTIRGAAPGESDTTMLHAQILAPGAASMAGASQGGITAAPTYGWLREHRTVLIQDDCREDPLPPRMLTEEYGVGAQLLGPLLRDGDLVGTVSVHHEGGPRSWTPQDVTAVLVAVERLRPVWQLDGDESSNLTMLAHE
jgi:GAF domain-containing protein